MRAQPKTDDRSLLCSEPGCCQRWTSNYGRRWCAEHDPGLGGHQATRRQSTLNLAPPLRDVLPPFNERAERDGDAA